MEARNNWLAGALLLAAFGSAAASETGIDEMVVTPRHSATALTLAATVDARELANDAKTALHELPFAIALPKIRVDLPPLAL